MGGNLWLVLSDTKFVIWKNFAMVKRMDNKIEDEQRSNKSRGRKAGWLGMVSLV